MDIKLEIETICIKRDPNFKPLEFYAWRHVCPDQRMCEWLEREVTDSSTCPNCCTVIYKEVKQ